jgi:hypothetical protein
VIKSSTSSSTVFNWLLGSGGYASSGSTVYVKSGSYLVDSTWNINVNSAYVSFQSGAILKAKNYLDGTVLVVNSNNVVIDGVTIDGNAYNQNPGSNISNAPDGIIIWGSYCVVTNSVIHNCLGYGVETIVGHNSGIQNSKIYDIGWNGFTAYNAPNSFCINCEVYRCSDVGIDSYASDCVFTGNYVHDMSVYIAGGENSLWGIALEGDTGGSYSWGTGTGNGNYFLIANNTITNCAVGIIAGTSTNSGDYLLISGNTLINCTTTHFYSAIDLYHSSSSIVEYNNIKNSDVGIGIEYAHIANGLSCVGNTVYGNTFSSCSQNIVDYGTSTTNTQPYYVAVTVTSSPTGSGYITVNGSYGCAGTYSITPHTFYTTVGSSINLAANSIVSGKTFANWSDGGAMSHTITVPSSNPIYVATYT